MLELRNSARAGAQTRLIKQPLRVLGWGAPSPIAACPPFAPAALRDEDITEDFVETGDFKAVAREMSGPSKCLLLQLSREVFVPGLHWAPITGQHMPLCWLPVLRSRWREVRGPFRIVARHLLSDLLTHREAGVVVNLKLPEEGDPL